MGITLALAAVCGGMTGYFHEKAATVNTSFSPLQQRR